MLPEPVLPLPSTDADSDCSSPDKKPDMHTKLTSAAPKVAQKLTPSTRLPPRLKPLKPMQSPSVPSMPTVFSALEKISVD